MCHSNGIRLGAYYKMTKSKSVFGICARQAHAHAHLTTTTAAAALVVVVHKLCNRIYIILGPKVCYNLRCMACVRACECAGRYIAISLMVALALPNGRIWCASRGRLAETTDERAHEVMRAPHQNERCVAVRCRLKKCVPVVRWRFSWWSSSSEL